MGSTKLPCKNLPKTRTDLPPCPDSVQCDVCSKDIPVTKCEHGYVEDAGIWMELPDYMDGKYINDGCIDLTLCQECVQAVYDALRARGLRFAWDPH